jgi:hypothetical protein
MLTSNNQRWIPSFGQNIYTPKPIYIKMNIIAEEAMGPALTYPISRNLFRHFRLNFLLADIC